MPTYPRIREQHNQVDSIGTYGQLWATPTASTTLTGTLAAWTVTAVDCTAGAGARSLPAANSVAAGVAFVAKKGDTSTNALVVSRAGSDLIYGTGSGATTKTLTLAGEAVEFVSNGVDKWTIRASDTPSGVLATTFARGFPKYLEGVPLTIHGHSWTCNKGKYTAGGMDWPTKLLQRGVSTVTNYGISGQTMMEAAFSIIGTTWYTGSNGNTASAGNTRTWTAGGVGIVGLHCVLNDATRVDALNAAYQTGFQGSLRSAIAALIAGQRIEAEAGTMSGTWNSGTNTQMSGGSVRNNAAAGAGVDYIEWVSVTVPTGVTKVYVLTYAFDSGTNAAMLNVSVDGVAQVTDWDPVGKMKQFTTPLATNPTQCAAVIPITVTAGTRTIRVTHSATRATGAAWVDALLIPSATPPLVLVLKEPNTVTGAGYSANAAVYDAFVDSVVAEFPSASVKTVALSTGWDISTMMGVDATHPNARGTTQIADLVDVAIRAAITDYTAGVTHNLV